MHIFTSITANYLPKAAALAHSVKRVHPEAVFHVVLCDQQPVCASSTFGAFDSIINITELPIPDLQSWIFKHRLVELCTAVKGTAFQYIADRMGAERIYYFDPDIVVLSRLDGLERKLDRNCILLTPHMVEPETDTQAILDNEICCLRHGVYNLGFLAVRTSGQGRRFIDWWAERLRQVLLRRSAETVSSPISDGSTWRRLFSMTSRSCASLNTTSRPGTLPTDARPAPRLLRSGSTTASWSFTIFQGSTAAPSGTCSIATARTARSSLSFESGTSLGARSSDNRAWEEFLASTTSSVMEGASGMRIAWLTAAARISRSTFLTRSRRTIRGALSIDGSSSTRLPKDSGRWSSCYGDRHHGRRFSWPVQLARHGAAGRSRHKKQSSPSATSYEPEA